MITAALNVWLNVAAILAFVGFAVYCTLLRSTTWFDGDE